MTRLNVQTVNPVHYPPLLRVVEKRAGMCTEKPVTGAETTPTSGRPVRYLDRRCPPKHRSE